MPWEALAKWGTIVVLVLAILGFLYWRWESLVAARAAYKVTNKRHRNMAAAEKRRAEARAHRATADELLRIARRKSRATQRPTDPKP